ncbi:hypothetical protein NL676_017512 [Syzygium grande]|nr:hypothetical protein NL676_017512 [Syzygium grande]
MTHKTLSPLLASFVVRLLVAEVGFICRSIFLNRLPIFAFARRVRGHRERGIAGFAIPRRPVCPGETGDENAMLAERPSEWRDVTIQASGRREFAFGSRRAPDVPDRRPAFSVRKRLLLTVVARIAIPLAFFTGDLPRVAALAGAFWVPLSLAAAVALAIHSAVWLVFVSLGSLVVSYSSIVVARVVIPLTFFQSRICRRCGTRVLLAPALASALVALPGACSGFQSVVFGLFRSSRRRSSLRRLCSILSDWRRPFLIPMGKRNRQKHVHTLCTWDDNLQPGYGLKPSLYGHWLNIYETSGGSDFHMSKERLFFSLCNSYRDILNCSKRPFYHKGHGEDSSTMDAYIMHFLNHIFRTRDIVTRNDRKMAKHQEAVKDEILSGGEFLDHGFTRPKVLILLPLCNIAFRVVKRLIQLTPSNHKVNVEYLGRFSDDFGAGEAHDNKDTEVFQDVHGSGQKSSKPTDFCALFDGNPDDHFMVGIKFTRKSIKLYSDFYTSDMIVASPLGLITKIGEAEREKEKDVDYLSSIEMLIIDHADVIAMQNWSHVDAVVEKLNRLPSKQHGMDVMRTRQWYLDGYARFYRQSIVLGYFFNPDMNALFNHRCLNYEGKVKLVCEYKGILPKVLIQAHQLERIVGSTAVKRMMTSEKSAAVPALNSAFAFAFSKKEETVGAFTFVCRSSGDEWTAKQVSGDPRGLRRRSSGSSSSPPSPSPPPPTSSSGGVQSSSSLVTPSSAVFQVN